MKYDEAQCTQCGTIKKMYLMVVKPNGAWLCVECDPLCEPSGAGL